MSELEPVSSQAEGQGQSQELGQGSIPGIEVCVGAPGVDRDPESKSEPRSVPDVQEQRSRADVVASQGSRVLPGQFLVRPMDLYRFKEPIRDHQDNRQSDHMRQNVPQCGTCAGGGCREQPRYRGGHVGMLFAW